MSSRDAWLVSILINHFLHRIAMICPAQWHERAWAKRMLP